MSFGTQFVYIIITTVSVCLCSSGCVSTFLSVFIIFSSLKANQEKWLSGGEVTFRLGQGLWRL